MNGIDTEHAAPGSPCFGCHRLMDPMRAYFQNSLTDEYRSAAPSARSPAYFAFDAVREAGSDLPDFARSIAQHPRFATAWVLRLCAWANSRSCSEGESEVIRLRDLFVSSRFDFRALVVHLLSSPLVTGLVETPGAMPQTISIARRRHLCAMLSARLGRVSRGQDACAALFDVARLLPDDSFARGQPELIQTREPGTFQAAALERLCAEAAPAVVERQCGTAEDQAAACIRGLVEGVMGLPGSHPRHGSTVTALDEHYRGVLGALASTSLDSRRTALASAFVVACTSPDAQGVGL